MSTRIAAAFFLLAVTVVSALAANGGASLDRLQGRWVVAKTNQDGMAYSQVIEIQKDQLTFQMLSADSKLLLVSKATVKSTQSGPFNFLSVSDIRAGRALDEMESVDDSRTLIYTIRDGYFIFASNFDKERENENPAVEVYVRKEAAPDPEAKLIGNWKMQVTLGADTWDYELRIAKPRDRLQATIISPRSGEHKCKTIQLKNGELLIEVDREIQGTPLTFVYQAKPMADGLSGKAQVKGHEDQYTGTWKASRQ